MFHLNCFLKIQRKFIFLFFRRLLYVCSIALATRITRSYDTIEAIAASNGCVTVKSRIHVIDEYFPGG